MNFVATQAPKAHLGLRVIRAPQNAETRKAPLAWKLANALRPAFIKGWIAVMLVRPFANFWGLATIHSELEIRVRRLYDEYREEYDALKRVLRKEAGDDKEALALAEAQLEAYRASHSWWEDYGVVSRRVITDAGVAYLVDDWDGSVTDFTNFNYHGIGTNNTAEAAGDTALGAESTTNLNPDNTRATGTRTQPAANQGRTVGTLTADGAIAAVEHGIFSQSATGGGTLWDRSVYSTINLASGDSLQATHTTTYSSGG